MLTNFGKNFRYQISRKSVGIVSNCFWYRIKTSDRMICCRASGFDVSKKCVAFSLKALLSFETSVIT